MGISAVATARIHADDERFIAEEMTLAGSAGEKMGSALTV